MANTEIPGSRDPVDRIVTVGVEAVDWTTQADEWQHHAHESLSDGGRATVTGSRYGATTQPFIEITVSSFDDRPTNSRFLFAPLNEGGVLVAVGALLGEGLQ